jgi:uncharacterized protein
LDFFIIGKNWAQRIIVLGAIILYLYLFLTKSETARKGFSEAVGSFFGLIPLIFAALLIAQAINILLPDELIMQWFGEKSSIICHSTDNYIRNYFVLYSVI